MTSPDMEVTGLTEENWSALEAIVQSTFKSHARVRTLLPRVEQPNAYSVLMPSIQNVGNSNETLLELETVHSQSPIRVARRFRVREEQLGDRHLMSQLTRRAARDLAFTEDVLLAFGGSLQTGKPSILDLLPVGTDGIRNLTDSTHGLSNASPPRAPAESKPGTTAHPAITPSAKDVATKDAAAQAEQKGGDPLEELAAALAELQCRRQTGPYAAVFLPAAWKKLTTSMSSNNDRIGYDVVWSMLGAEQSAIALPLQGTAHDHRIIVFSTAPDTVELVEVTPPTLALDAYQRGDLILRVQHAFVLRIVDANARIDVILS